MTLFLGPKHNSNHFERYVYGFLAHYFHILFPHIYYFHILAHGLILWSHGPPDWVRGNAENAQNAGNAGNAERIPPFFFTNAAMCLTVITGNFRAANFVSSICLT